MIRKQALVTGEYYHVFNKSISGYRVFNSDAEYNRMRYLFGYYQFNDVNYSFTRLFRHSRNERPMDEMRIRAMGRPRNKQVEIIAYCIMPTHIHLVLKQVTDGGISAFLGKVTNSYAKYFNKKHDRHGPLWVGRFKNVHVNDDEQMWHLTRYVHLNPTTAGLVTKPQDWVYSSYHEYLGKVSREKRLSRWEDVMETTPSEYKKFVEDRLDYQKSLSILLHLMIDE